MKIRIMAMLLAAVMLLTLLPGCGAAEAEPEATTMAATEAPTTEATTEPTTEPTTVPTEPPVPPTLLEEQGYTFWEGASEVVLDTQPGKWSNKGDFIPLSAKLAATYKDIQMQFAIVGSDRKEYRDMVDTDVDILMYEISGSDFDAGMDWFAEKLTPFHTAWQKRESGKASFEEWITENQDQKLIYTKVSYVIKGTDHYLKTIENGVNMKDLKVMHSYPDLVDAETGSVFCIREKYDPYKPEVGCWSVGEEGSETQIQAWFTRNFNWNVQEGKKANVNVSFEYYVLVPADYDGISFCMQEYATAEDIGKRLILGNTGKSWWGVGTIFEDGYLNNENYTFHFFSLREKK